MKKLIPVLLFVIINTAVHSQGLENVIVETYYISDANDTMVNADGGVLPVGSVTYRIYADLLPGYRWQAGYGIPGHELRFETSTLFFNNEDRGATTPTYSKVNAKNNTVMLDTWLSVGAGCAGNYGVLKSSDDGVATIVNNDNVLLAANPLAGIALTTEDGLVTGTPEAVTIVGITTEIAMFDNQNDGTNGPLFTTTNGSWASLVGSVGVDTVANQVLIGQFTTDGLFSFKLNIQIGTPSLGVENYVAELPVGNEIQRDFLIYPVPVGIEAVSEKNNFLLFPNPANELLKIKMFNDASSKKVSYRILNVNGAEVQEKNLENISVNHVETINIASLTPGLYFLELNMDGVKSVKKLIKQ
ncbi:MAG: T9SS type A sorting domain-containing protein [Bacteroidota bacterium]